jgi:hypothetical protein
MQAKIMLKEKKLLFLHFMLASCGPRMGCGARGLKPRKTRKQNVRPQLKYRDLIRRLR